MRKVLLVGSLAIAACGGGDKNGGSEPVRVSSVVLSHSSANVSAGDSVRITATPTDANGNALSGKSVSWSTSSAAVASVSTAGWVRGVSAGNATITAASDGKTAQLPVAVAPAAVATIEVTPPAVAIQVGQTSQLTAILKDARNNVLTGRAVSWASSDPNIATVVSTSGLVTAVSNGSASITATVETKVAQAQISVGSSTAPLIASVSAALLAPGATVTITGQNFGTSPAQNLVTIDGVSASVSAASEAQLTIALPPASSFPCEATHNANVVVSVNGLTGSRLVPLQVASQRSLAPGQSVTLQAQGEVRCNELSQTGGRYLVNVFNTSTTLSSTSPLQLRGAAATALNAMAIPPTAGGVSPRMSGTRSVGSGFGLPYGSPELQIRRKVGRAHRADLEEDRALFRAGASTARARRSQSGGGSTFFKTGRPSLNINVVGDTTTMKIPNRALSNFCTSAPISIRARTVYSGTRAIILEDAAAPLAGTMDSYYQQIGQEFDNTMFPIIVNNFGNPLAYDGQLDANNKIIMLFSKKVNDFDRILGFVTACDFFDPAQQFSDGTYPIASNKAEIFYAVAPTTAAAGYATDLQNMTKDGWRRLIRGTVIHEVKHLTMYAERFASPIADVLEESWLEEGTAMHSEELLARTITGATFKGNTGYGSSANPTGLFCEVRPGSSACPPDRPLLVFAALAWLHDHLRNTEDLSMLGRSPNASNDATFYGSSWAFVRWVIDHHYSNDATFLKALIAEPHLTGVQNVVARVGRTYPDMLAEFTLALALDDRPGFTPARSQLSFLTWNFSDLFAGLNADFSNNSPNPFPFAHPLQPRQLAFGSFTSDVNSLRAGTSAYFEVSGSQLGKQLIEVRSQGGGDPAPSLRVSIVRIQ